VGFHLSEALGTEVRTSKLKGAAMEYPKLKRSLDVQEAATLQIRSLNSLCYLFENEKIPPDGGYVSNIFYGVSVL